MSKPFQARQGDVLVVQVDRPAEGDVMNRHMGHVTLAHGEVTGHFHGIKHPEAVMFRPDDAPGGCFALKITADEVVLEHTKGNAPAEHAPVTIPAGNFVSLVPYEYDETGDAKRVVD